jgi:two-component system, chemotaxis family, CheB/CheR fusion protein
MKEIKNLKKNIRNQYSEDNTNKTDIVKKGFSIVGIGASAGGLEALLAFLGNVPENSGLAFVIVQHMEQMRESM